MRNSTGRRFLFRHPTANGTVLKMAIAGMRSEQKKTPFHAGEGRKQPIVQRAILLFPCRERKVFYSLAADVLHSNNYVIVEVNNFRRKFFFGGVEKKSNATGSWVDSLLIFLLLSERAPERGPVKRGGCFERVA